MLTKMLSPDTAKDFEKAGRGDLYQYMMTQRAQGASVIGAWRAVIESEVAKNPNLKPALAQMQTAKTEEEQAAALSAIKGMAGGQAIAMFFLDMQAKGAIFGLLNKQVEDGVNKALAMSDSIVDTDYAYMADKAGVKTRIASETGEMAKIEAMDNLTPAIGRAADVFTELASKYPELTGAVMLSTTALGAFAATTGIASAMMGGGGLSGALGLFGGGLGGATGQLGAFGGAAGGAVSAIGTFSAALGVFAASYAVGSWINKKFIEGTEAGNVIGRAGAAVMAMFGSETAREAIQAEERAKMNKLKAERATAAGGNHAATVYSALHPSQMAATGVNAWVKPMPPQKQQVDLKTTMQVGLSPGLVLQKQSVQATGASVTTSAGAGRGNLWQGAPG